MSDLPNRSEEIKPALSKDEFDEYDGWDFSYWIKDHDGETEEEVRKMRHGLAALALYGQPFGFTWEDVRQLRDVAETIAGEWGLGGRWEDQGDDADIFAEWKSLIDRIAALLPPKEGAKDG